MLFLDKVHTEFEMKIKQKNRESIAAQACEGKLPLCPGFRAARAPEQVPPLPNLGFSTGRLPIFGRSNSDRISPSVCAPSIRSLIADGRDTPPELGKKDPEKRLFP